MSANDRWHAARLASNRPLPKPRKMHGPVEGVGARTQESDLHRDRYAAGPGVLLKSERVADACKRAAKELGYKL